MGSELNTKAKPGLHFNRHITGFVAGTSKIKEIAIIRNGTVCHTFKPDGNHFEFAHDDMDPLPKIALESKGDKPPFIYYYMRVIQEDGHIGWTSPIWIDITDTSFAMPPKKAKKK